MAAPNPELEFRRLEKICGGDSPPGLVLIRGSSRWFRDRALARLRELWKEAGEFQELDGEEVGEDGRRVSEFLLDLRTASLFSGARFLLLRHAERILRRFGEAFLETVEKTAKGNRLIVEVAKLDGRSKLARSFRERGEVFEFRDLYTKPFDARKPPASAEIVRWVTDRGAAHGLSLGPEAALFLVTVVGGDPGRIDGELSRLSSAGLSKRPGPEDLRVSLQVSFGASQFDLVDAVLEGDLPAALRANRALYQEGLRDREGKRIEPSAVFPLVSSWMHTCLAKLRAARDEVDSGSSISEAAARHGGFFRDRFAGQLRRHDRASLARLGEALLRAEVRLRTMGEDPELLLERWISECCLKGCRRILGPFEALGI